MRPPALEVDRISKSFFGARALLDVGFSLRYGEVLGLVGENGAGKSTLMNIVGGALQPDAGRMRLDGAPFRPANPRQAAAAGVAIVHQELNLFPNLSVAENLFLADPPRTRRLGVRWIDWRELRRRAAERLAAVELDLDPATLVEALSPGQRQLVEIAKALEAGARLVVFDEPTTSLTRPEAERLFAIIERLRRQQAAVVYISHQLGDVLRLCDSLVVLRDGQVQARGPAAEFSPERMIAAMIGRTLASLYPRREGGPSNEVVLEVEGLTQEGVVADVSFALRRGELLGISGLMGSGRTELARMLFGLDRFSRGTIRLGGRPLANPSPRRCIARGMAFLTEDRKAEGLVADADLEANLTLAALDRFRGPLGTLRGAQARHAAADMLQTLGVECRGLDQPARTLSGGNQQKIVLGKWLLGGSSVLLLDEPTRGIDVGAKREIYEQLVRLAERGAGVVVISSELEELVGLCDRILVMARGRVEAVVERRDFDRSDLLRSALGERR